MIEAVVQERAGADGDADPFLIRGADEAVVERVAAEEAEAPWPMGLLARVNWSLVGVAVGLLLFAVAAIVLYRLLEQVTWTDVEAAVGRRTWLDLGLATGATALSYAALVGYDAVALHHVAPRKVPIRAVAFTSFISHAITYTLGFGVFTGGAVRWRLYQGYGLSAAEILAVGALCALTFWLGTVTAAGIGLVAQPGAAMAVDLLPAGVNLGIGLAILAAIAVWLFVAGRPRTITLGGWTMPLPGRGGTLAAMAVGIVDIGAAALALWLLLPAGHDVGFAGFLVVFAVAIVLGVISHVPGGVGVFEATILLALPGIPEAETLGSLLLFRILYYALPFALAGALIGAHELRQRIRGVRHAVRSVGSTVGTLAGPLVPRAAGAAVFVGGVVLLLSGATPAEQVRIHVLRGFVPLPFVEASHLAASMTGLVLLVVAHGLVRRMANAWRLAVVLLLAGAAFSILKGLDFEEAIICSAVAGLLVASKSEFYRQADLFAVRPTPEWIAAVAVAIGASVWLGLFVWRNVQYQDMLWWDFAYHADAPRFMRASLAVLATALGIAAYVVLHRTAAPIEPAAGADLLDAEAVVRRSGRCESHLALLGDKNFLFSQDRTGLVMYGVQGGSYIAMGDPLAPEEEVDDLVWRFRELVDRRGGTPVFYQITTDHLPVYLDAGFSLAKLGEEAWVDLSRFTLEGGEGRRLRQARTKAERSGATLEIVPAGQLDPLLDEIEAVSNAWLAEKNNKEKGFSLGFWSRRYIAAYDVAIIRLEGRIVAFANIWRSADRREITVDLMRHGPDAPSGMMDLLFIGLMAEAKAEGYAWFNLGMAPLSGLPTHRLASSWSRLGALLYRRGGRFYNFEGLRSFKEKFKPQWRPKYLAYPNGFALPQILVDVTALIASSPRRALSGEKR